MDKADRIIVCSLVILLLVVSVISHFTLSNRIEELEITNQKRIEQEKNIIGYWSFNPVTYQLTYIPKE